MNERNWCAHSKLSMTAPLIYVRSRHEQTTIRSVTCTSKRFPSCGASVHGASGGGSRAPRCLGGKPRRVGTRASASRRHRLPLRVKKAVRGLGTFRSRNPWKWPSANGDPRTSSWPRSRAWPSTRHMRTTLHSGRRARARSCDPPRTTTRRSSGRGDPRRPPPSQTPPRMTRKTTSKTKRARSRGAATRFRRRRSLVPRTNPPRETKKTARRSWSVSSRCSKKARWRLYSRNVRRRRRTNNAFRRVAWTSVSPRTRSPTLRRLPNTRVAKKSTRD